MLVMLYLITANTYASVDGPRDRNFSYIGKTITIIVIGNDFRFLIGTFIRNLDGWNTNAHVVGTV